MSRPVMRFTTVVSSANTDRVQPSPIPPPRSLKLAYPRASPLSHGVFDMEEILSGTHIDLYITFLQPYIILHNSVSGLSLYKPICSLCKYRTL